MSIETITKKLFTVDEYHRMFDAGILSPDHRFQLIRGEIIEMPVPKSQHSGRVNRLNRLFTSRLGESVIVSVQNPVWLDELSEPVPDLVLLRPRADFYTDLSPSPEDVFLLVEISHTTVQYDTKIKAPLYAEAGIPEYWLLNINQDALEVRTHPADGKYTSLTVFRRGQTISPQKLPATTFSIDEILG